MIIKENDTKIHPYLRISEKVKSIINNKIKSPLLLPVKKKPRRMNKQHVILVITVLLITFVVSAANTIPKCAYKGSMFSYKGTALKKLPVEVSISEDLSSKNDCSNAKGPFTN